MFEISFTSRSTLAAAFVLFAAVAAHGETQVSGQGDVLRVEARDASVGEMLASLNAKFELRSSEIHLDRPVSGHFAGPARKIIAELLAGYNYIMTTDDRGALHVIVYERGKGPAKAGAPQGITPASAPGGEPAVLEKLPRREPNLTPLANALENINRANFDSLNPASAAPPDRAPAPPPAPANTAPGSPPYDAIAAAQRVGLEAVENLAAALRARR